jgi:hypothetical protein
MILYEMVHGYTLDKGMDIKVYFEDIKTDPHFIEKRISPAISLQVK